MEKNTQHPVAWLYHYTDSDGDLNIWTTQRRPEVVHAHELPRVSNITPLYPSTPVPRDVLMAFGEAVQNACYEAAMVRQSISGAKWDRFTAGKCAEAVSMVNTADLADRYASQVQPEPVNPQTLAALNRLADASRPVATALYNIGQQHEDWSSLRQLIAELDSARSHGYAVIAAAEAAQPVGQPIEWQFRRKDWPEWKRWQNISKDEFLHMQTNAEHWQEYEIRQLFASGQQEIQA